ncbi:MAG TPA: hypothetical protein VM925_30015, partial [Labilithrix sp.]|nr:hypothetical protein [Labilithrix sp.]
MRRSVAIAGCFSIATSIALAQAQPTSAPPAVPPEAPQAPASAPAPAPAPVSAKAPAPPTRGDRMRAYHDAMLKRRLGSQEGVTENLAERVADAEALVSAGRRDEAIAKLTEIVEHPRFEMSADSPEGRAALYL